MSCVISEICLHDIVTKLYQAGQIEQVNLSAKNMWKKLSGQIKAVKYASKLLQQLEKLWDEKTILVGVSVLISHVVTESNKF